MSLVDTIRNQLSGDALAGLGAAIGAPEEEARAAAEAAAPAILSSLSNVVLEGKGLGGLLEALHDFEGTDPAENPWRSSPDAPPGNDVLGSILGPNLEALAKVLAKFSGLAVPAARALLERLGPIVLGAVAAKLRGSGGLTAANLTSFFASEKAAISRALPAGLSLADLPSIPGVPTTAPGAIEVPSGLPAWAFPALIVGILAVAGIFYVLMPPERPAPPPDAVDAKAEAAPIPPAPLGD